MPFPYEFRIISEELEIYEVRKTNTGDTYRLEKQGDGGFSHHPRCKALEVYGNDFLCRHKKMILGKYYAREEFKHLFNISPRRKRRTKKGGEDKSI
jgi:hypothetical protein